MKQEIIDQMTQIVESNMESFKSDFYKFDINALNEYNGPFVWSVARWHTHLERLDAFMIAENLSNNERARFLFMASDELVFGASVNYDAENTNSLIYLYDGVELKKIDTSALHNVLLVTNLSVRQHIVKNFPDELEHYGKPTPVHFRSPEVFRNFMEIARSEEGHLLLRCVKNSFRRWVRMGKNDKIFIGSDFARKSFSFWTERNGEVKGLNGSIIYHEGSENGWSIHT